MSAAALQLQGSLDQPRLPSPAPPTPQNWTGDDQPGWKKPPRAVGVFFEEGLGQPVKEQVAANRAISGLDQIYVIEDRPLVTRFIEQNRLHGLLLQAGCPLSEAFGADAVKVLSLVRDEEGFETLFCLVASPGAMQQARAALRRFDQQWWLSRCGRVAGKLNFDFELV